MVGSRKSRVIDLEELMQNGVMGKKRIAGVQQTFTFSCGFSLFTRFVRLQPGQYVDITCASGPISIRIGCGNQFLVRIATFNLQPGQAVEVAC
jgi:hypothetical protein